MNAVEVYEQVEALAAELETSGLDASAFPAQFLAAFGFGETTIKQLGAGRGGQSDVPGAVLLRRQAHMLVAERGGGAAGLAALRGSPRTAKDKVKYLIVTDGELLEAELVATGEVLACPLGELARHFGFFLPLAGISTVAEIKDNPIDIRATGRLNKLYLELLKDNPRWADELRPQLNQFMTRLIFCFFAEDTGIFLRGGMFTECLARMSDATNTHEILAELFRAMNLDKKQRHLATPALPAWTEDFPYVNGGLFKDELACPRFSKMARSYLLRVGELDWKQINPDIFGSMIQAVANEDERSALGTHYTSVPNILKVLDPLVLGELREQLAAAGTSAQKLAHLHRRLASIRIFDPACGSGNFLVVAYIQLRALEAEIFERLGTPLDSRRSALSLANFYGIEIQNFAAEVARLSLLIAEFQCNVRHRGQQRACLDMLPLRDTGRIVCGNALRLDWTEVCPPSQDAETYLCGNPPYLGFTWQSEEQKKDLEVVFSKRLKGFKSLDYVAGWFMKSADYAEVVASSSAFVSTNSICQGEQVPLLWPLIFAAGREISFAYTSFRWANLAAHNAGVTVAIVGTSAPSAKNKYLFETEDDGRVSARQVSSINAYLTAAANVIVREASCPLYGQDQMLWGNKAVDGGHLLLTRDERDALISSDRAAASYLRPFFGSIEYIRGGGRYCLWLHDDDVRVVVKNAEIKKRLDRVREFRSNSPKRQTQLAADTPHKFSETRDVCNASALIIPGVSSESRPYLPVGPLPKGAIVSNLAFAMYDAPLWNMAIIASRLHLVWVATVCGKLETRYRYSNTLGWNTFPIPQLTQADKAELTRCAEDIVLAREAHFPATIADLYAPDAMPADLRVAHERNDETLERIYIGRRFRNDSERLEKLFALYAQHAGATQQNVSRTGSRVAKPAAATKPAAKKGRTR